MSTLIAIAFGLVLAIAAGTARQGLTRVLALAMSVCVVGTGFLWGVYRVPSGSMRPSMIPADYVLVSRVEYGMDLPGIGRIASRNPNPGQVVIFNRPDTGEIFVKRVIAVAGDVLVWDHGRLRRNGNLLTNDAFERAVDVDRAARVLRGTEENRSIQYPIFMDAANDEGTAIPGCTVSGVCVVPEGFVVVLGDNRANSVDSRVFGLVPVSQIRGRVIWTLFNLQDFSRFGAV